MPSLFPPRLASLAPWCGFPSWHWPAPSEARASPGDYQILTLTEASPRPGEPPFHGTHILHSHTQAKLALVTQTPYSRYSYSWTRKGTDHCAAPGQRAPSATCTHLGWGERPRSASARGSQGGLSRLCEQMPPSEQKEGFTRQGHGVPARLPP